MDLLGTLLAADTGARTLTYRLLPFGEMGRTSAGAVTASAGTLELPDPGSMILNLEHDPTRPVGRGAALAEDASGLTASFHIAQTTAGNDLLVEAAAGLRTGISVELEDAVVRNGALLGGRLTGAGAVTRPAFPSAQLLVAADTPDPAPAPAEDVDPEDDPESPDEIPEDTVTDTHTAAAGAPAATGPDAPVLAASAPLGGTPTQQAAQPLTFGRATTLMAQLAEQGVRPDRLMAALADTTATGTADTQRPQWIDEVWQGVPYERQIVPLIGTQPLTSLKVQGWKFNAAPVGDDYTGDKAAVPSAAVTTAAVEYVAERWAGAHDIDRALVDFSVPSFWDAYYRAMAASYAKWSDDKAAAGLLAAAGASVPGGTGVVAAIVGCALDVIPTGTPSFCLLGSTAFAELVERDPLAFLSGSLSLPSADGKVGGLSIAFRASAGLAADQVLVATRNAADWYELSGTPIRVEALNIANGGVDAGCFGYGVIGVHDAAGIKKATVT